MEKKILPTENIARFILQKSHYRPSNNTVKHSAFMPSSKMEVSVYRVDELRNEEINEIGNEFVAKALNKKLLGRAEIIVSKILAQKLSAESHPDPHPRHANIVGWHEDDRSKNRLIAMVLASESNLILVQ